MMFRPALTQVFSTLEPWVAHELRTESGRMTSLSSGESAAHPDRIDTSRPHPARMYDYFLGGKDNYEVDQRAAEQFMKSAPEVREGVLANRHFMHRAVRHVVAEGGVRQILDVGTGLPTEPNVHQIARSVAPGTRVAYVEESRTSSTRTSGSPRRSSNAPGRYWTSTARSPSP